MPLSREDLADLLAALEASIDELAAGYEENPLLVEAIVEAGEDIANEAGAERHWVEERVAQILVRHGLVEGEPPEG